MDKRRHFILMLDTETANTIVEPIPAEYDEEGNEIKPASTRMDMSNVLVYDCGWAIIDTKGHVYRTRSYVNRDIFVFERDLMHTAYYAKKIPQYIDEIRAGTRIMADLYEIRQAMLADIAEFGIKEVAAHNARFDHNGLNITQRYVSKSKYRYWFPFDSVVFWDTMKMAQDVICKMPTYKAWCAERGYVLPNGAPRKTAEILYRFISGKEDFDECHTGLEDVLIEAEILWYCFRQHKPMRKLLFENAKEFPPMTQFQMDMLHSIKTHPTIRGAWH